MRKIKFFSFLVVVFLMMFIIQIPKTSAYVSGENWDNLSEVYPKKTVTLDNRYQTLNFVSSLDDYLLDEDGLETSLFTGSIEVYFNAEDINWDKLILDFKYSKDKGLVFSYPKSNYLPAKVYEFYDLRNLEAFTYFDYSKEFTDEEGYIILFDFSLALDIAHYCYNSREIYVALRANESRLTNLPVTWQDRDSDYVSSAVYEIMYIHQSSEGNILIHKDFYSANDNQKISLYKPSFYSKEQVSYVWDRNIMLNGEIVDDSNTCYIATKDNECSAFTSLTFGYPNFVITADNKYFSFKYLEDVEQITYGTLTMFFDDNDLSYYVTWSIYFTSDKITIELDKNDVFYDYFINSNLTSFELNLLTSLSSYSTVSDVYLDFSVIYDNAVRLLGINELYLVFINSDEASISLFEMEPYQLMYVEMLNSTSYYYTDNEGIDILYDKKMFLEDFFKASDVNIPDYSILGYYSGKNGTGIRYYPDSSFLISSKIVYTDVSWNFCELNYITGDSSLSLDSKIISKNLDFSSEDLVSPGERKGYVFIGWKFEGFEDDQYIAEGDTLYDHFSNPRFTSVNLVAVWITDKTFNINLNNPVILLRFPSINVLNEQLIDFYDPSSGAGFTFNISYDGIDVFLDDYEGYDYSGSVIEFINYINYEVIYNLDGSIDIYIDFTYLIKAVNDNYRYLSNHIYECVCLYQEDIFEENFLKNYKFERSSYRNLKVYCTSLYSYIEKEVVYHDVDDYSNYRNLTSTISYPNSTTLIVTRMYYIKNGRAVEVSEGDTLVGNYTIFVDLSNLVIFNANNNTANYEQYVIHESPIAEPKTPSKKGYNFVGWYSDEELTDKWDFTYSVMGDMTLYAKWEVINGRIIFNSLGGSAVQDLVAPIYSSITEPEEPTKYGYTFAGWYLSVQFTQEYNFMLMPEDNISLFAKWDPIVVTLTFDSNDGNDYIYTQKYLFGESSELSSNLFVREGYTFVGWNTKADGTGTSYKNKQLMAISSSSLNVIDSETPNVLYAMWEEGTYSTPAGDELIDNDNTSSSDIFSGEVTWAVLFSFIGFFAVIAFFIRKK